MSKLNPLMDTEEDLLLAQPKVELWPGFCYQNTAYSIVNVIIRHEMRSGLAYNGALTQKHIRFQNGSAHSSVEENVVLCTICDTKKCTAILSCMGAVHRRS